MRLFLAIELPEDVRDHLLVARRRLETGLPKIAYTKPENLHLTLKFLGEVEKKRVDAITESLSKISTQRMELQAAGIDCFPARGPIRIVTAAMSGTLPPLRALVDNIEQRCRFLGFEKEQRAYKPHVTLGRARPVLSAKFRQLAADATVDLWPGPTFAPAEFVLMDSQLSPEGSKYTTVARFPIP
ncbi:MAG: 2,3-cyclic 3-phosphodiesterase, partial [Humisphaera sp.]|nr:2,3-cyclic 3-phosphodiesterase [Humisphaera sp.]